MESREPFPSGDAGGPEDDEAYEAQLTALARVITHVGPDVLGVQEVGDPHALADLAERIEGEWHTEVSEYSDTRGIRVGFMSRLDLDDVEHVLDFPEALVPIQVDDQGTAASRMGRGALRVRLSDGGHEVDLLPCHTKSKLLTFPGGRFSLHDEAERARFGAYALYRRSAEAVTLRDYVDRLLDGRGQRARPRASRRSQRRAAGRDHPDSAWPAGL